MPVTVETISGCPCCSSSSSSSSSSSACVNNGCCDCLSGTLQATFTLGIGTDCSTSCGSFVATGAWNGAEWAFSGTFNCGISITAKLRCEGGLWNMYVNGCGFTNYPLTLSGSSCTPFEVDFLASFDSGSCCPDGSSVSGLSVTITL